MLSLAPEMELLLRDGVKVIMIAGDADYLCSSPGNQAVAEELHWAGQSTFVKQPLSGYAVDGTTRGLYKTVENLGMVTVFESGHDVPFNRKCWRSSEHGRY